MVAEATKRDAAAKAVAEQVIEEDADLAIAMRAAPAARLAVNDALHSRKALVDLARSAAGRSPREKLPPYKDPLLRLLSRHLAQSRRATLKQIVDRSQKIRAEVQSSV
jgi:hypothetical protein